jgi:tetratricopeptide (TPR) repeat protein
MRLKTVFLSSTYRDLVQHREAVMQALRRLDGYHCIAMEDFGARYVPPLEFVTAKVAAADVFIGLVGHLHGSCPDGEDRSFTECEYQAAVDNGKRCLMFIATEDFPVPENLVETDDKRRKQRAFRERVQNQRYIYDSFSSPDKLANHVVSALHNLVDQPDVAGPLPPQPAFVHPYPLQKNFVGRVRERMALTDWLTKKKDQPVMGVIAMGGMGKSALTWAWLLLDVLGLPLPGYVDGPAAKAPQCRVAESARPRGVFWWSFYERDASVSAFLDRVLVYVSDGRLDPAKISSISDKLEQLKKLIEKQKVLIVLDGFERQLRNYASKRKKTKDDLACTDTRVGDFLRDVASSPTKGRLLLTSRHTPRELQELAGFHEHLLNSLEPDDGVEFFHAQNIWGRRRDIVYACKRYEYHPLSLRVLTGVIRKHYGDAWSRNPESVFSKLKRKKHHILDVAYRSLSVQNRPLLKAISSFRSTADYSAISTLKLYRSKKRLNLALADLVDRDLAMVSTNLSQYDLHPIVRDYAYSRLRGAELEAIHQKLSRYFAKLSSDTELRQVSDFSNVIEQYHHTVHARNYEKAFEIIHDKLFRPLHYEYGDYRDNIELLRTLFPKSENGEERAPRLSKTSKKTLAMVMLTGTSFLLPEQKENPAAWAMNALGISYRACGFPRAAERLFRAANKSRRASGGGNDILIADLINLADVQWTIGRFRSADENLLQLIDLSATINDQSYKAVGHQDRGLRLAFRGLWSEAEREFDIAMHLALEAEDQKRQAIIYSHRTRKELLLIREKKSSRLADDAKEKALFAAKQSMDLLPSNLVERHYVRALWLLGESHLVNGELAPAEKYLHDALNECSRLDLIEFEAAMLLGIARYQMARGKFEEAKERASTALRIAKRSAFVLDETDAHLLLARLALRSRDYELAKLHATKAQTLAICDGLPDYSYKVAYDEARALVGRVKH